MFLSECQVRKGLNKSSGEHFPRGMPQPLYLRSDVMVDFKIIG